MKLKLHTNTKDYTFRNIKHEPKEEINKRNSESFLWKLKN